ASGGLAAALLATVSLAAAQEAPAPDPDTPWVDAEGATHVAHLGDADDGGETATVWFIIDPESAGFNLMWSVESDTFAPNALNIYCGEEPVPEGEPVVTLVDALGVGSVANGEIAVDVEVHDWIVNGQCIVAAESDGAAQLTGLIEPTEGDGGA